MTTKWLNLDTDVTLGGNSPSDYKAPSQKAIKTYVDSQSGSGGGTPDYVTINKNSSNALQAVGVIEKNASLVKYDWIGTLAQWTAGRNNGTIPDSWICYVTDDSVDIVIRWADITSTPTTLAGYGITDAQQALIAGDNIYINGTTISAKDTTYTAGDNITIEDNVISAAPGAVIKDWSNS